MQRVKGSAEERYRCDEFQNVFLAAYKIKHHAVSAVLYFYRVAKCYDVNKNVSMFKSNISIAPKTNEWC